MAHHIIKDAKRRNLFAKHEKKRIVLLSITHNQTLPSSVRFNAQLRLSTLPRNSAQNRIRNRCFITGRPRSVYRQWAISRIMLRQLMKTRDIVGLKKASW